MEELFTEVFRINIGATLEDAGGNEVVRLCAIKREFPQALNFEDGNWLMVFVDVQLPGADGGFSGPVLRADEIEALARDLRGLSQGTPVAFHPQEPNLRMMFTPKAGGVRVRVRTVAGEGEPVREGEFDTTILEIGGFVKGLQAILKKFPVLGRAK